MLFEILRRPFPHKYNEPHWQCKLWPFPVCFFPGNSAAHVSLNYFIKKGIFFQFTSFIRSLRCKLGKPFACWQDCIPYYDQTCDEALGLLLFGDISLNFTSLRSYNLALRGVSASATSDDMSDIN